jgi:hypothetical protein
VADVDGFLADLARWTAAARVDDAVTSRTRERWLRQQAAEGARFAGVALDLAERGGGVVIRTGTGRTLHGRIVALARDFCVVRHDGGAATFVALAAVATLRPEPGSQAREAASERAGALDADLADVLAGLAGDRPRVRIVVEGGGEAITGELRAVGVDVASVRLDGEPPQTVYVQLGSLRELTLVG